MTKELVVIPEEVRKRETIELGAIPVNSYARTLQEELDSNPDLTPAGCVRMFRDMALIREFETMLDNIKKLGAYEGIQYGHPGPAHLSLGQEGAACGRTSGLVTHTVCVLCRLDHAGLAG